MEDMYKYLSRVVHDIRTPMSTIIGMTEVARSSINDTAKIQGCLDKINISSNYLMTLINEIIDMSKIKTSHFSLNKENFNLYDMISDIVLLIKPQTDLKNQSLTVNISDIKHADVIGDSRRLQQCFLNFVTNSVKYTQNNGSINISVFEEPKQCSYSSVYKFVFEDNGRGMNPEFINHIFEPFSREFRVLPECSEEMRKSSYGYEIPGSGLGMSIAHSIVQMMGGSIDIVSKPDIGSRFTVTLNMKWQNL